jgi:hypothetical protein
MRPRPHCLTHGETVRSAADARSIRCRFHEHPALSTTLDAGSETAAVGQTQRRHSCVGQRVSRLSLLIVGHRERRHRGGDIPGVRRALDRVALCRDLDRQGQPSRAIASPDPSTRMAAVSDTDAGSAA